jgi:transcriptional regulator with XRE-family HTH domain
LRAGCSGKSLIWDARIAEVAGVNKSTVSRWRENLVPNMSLLLAILISNRDGVKGDFEA